MLLNKYGNSWFELELWSSVQLLGLLYSGALISSLDGNVQYSPDSHLRWNQSKQCLELHQWILRAPQPDIFLHFLHNSMLGESFQAKESRKQTHLRETSVYPKPQSEWAALLGSMPEGSEKLWRILRKHHFPVWLRDLLRQKLDTVSPLRTTGSSGSSAFRGQQWHHSKDKRWKGWCNLCSPLVMRKLFAQTVACSAWIWFIHKQILPELRF